MQTNAITAAMNPSPGPPPPYLEHLEDGMPDAPILLFGGDRPRQRPSSSASSNPPALTGPVSIARREDPTELILDQGSIYPPPPSSAIYNLPRLLNWSGNEIFLCRNLPPLPNRRSGTPAVRDQALYTIRRTLFTSDIALIPRQEGTKAATMRGKRGVLGNKTWQVEVKGETVLKYSRGRWEDTAGQLVAAERAAERTSRHGKRSTTNERNDTDYLEQITLSPGLDTATRDLIVAAWCSRLWHSNQKTAFAKA